jgi:hypothetical protein
VENNPEQKKKQIVPTASAVLEDGALVEMVFQPDRRRTFFVRGPAQPRLYLVLYRTTTLSIMKSSMSPPLPPDEVRDSMCSTLLVSRNTSRRITMMLPFHVSLLGLTGIPPKTVGCSAVAGLMNRPGIAGGCWV